MIKVLIADDEELIRKGLKSMLQRYKKDFYDIYLCADGDEAENILKENKIDILITDIRMPRLDGIELINYVKNFHKETSIVILSGYDDFNYAKEAIKCGAKEYLLKPINREKLYECMEKIEIDINKNEEYKKAYCASQFNCLVKKEGLSEDILDKIKKVVSIDIFNNYYIGIYTISNLENKSNNLSYIEDIKKDRKERIIYFFNSECFLTVISESEKMLVDILKSVSSDEKVGISMPHNSIESIKIAYHEAKEAFKNRIMDYGNIIYYKNIKNRIKKASTPNNKIDSIFNMIEAGRINDVETNLNELFNREKINKYCVDYFLNIDSLMKEKLRQIDIEFDKNEMYSYSNIFEYIDEVTHLAVSVTQRIQKQMSYNNTNLSVKRAVEYVNKNYNKDINLAMIANEVNLNYTYFCELFKEYTKDTFVNYVKKLRVQKAKEMLSKNTNYKIYEIANIVGYDNPRQFAKIFRKITGITPIEYKNKYSKEIGELISNE